MTNMIEIDEGKYKELLRDQMLLEAFRSLGVDNWEGYEFAMQDYRDLLTEHPELKDNYEDDEFTVYDYDE